MTPPPILRTLAQLRARTRGWHTAGESIAVVPTMGALHDGHLSLVAAARAACARVVVTIFVNPGQFDNAGDLARYPRSEGDDARKLARMEIDALYAPAPDQVYPPGFATSVSVAGLTDTMEGAHRPGHFDAVATVCTKLFTQTTATDAFFGEKDFQQLQVVRRLARDLDLAVTIHGCPTIRDIDGLALSSRNLLLSDRARAIAPRLYEEMAGVARGLAAGEAFATLRRAAIDRLGRTGFTGVDYLDLRAADDLAPLETPARPARLLAAAWLAGVRLIDNIAV